MRKTAIGFLLSLVLTGTASGSVAGAQNASDATDSVALSYQGLLGRTPSTSDVSYWSELDSATMIHSIIESPEFKQKNTHPIFAVYVNLLGREPEPEAFYYWSGVPTEEAIAHILDSPEVVATTGLDFIWTHKSIEQILIDAANEFGINPAVFLRIAWCESNHDPDATNPSSGAAGLLQHLPQYFGSRAAAVGMAGASIYDPVANARAGAWLMSQQGTQPWSCK